MNTRTSQMQLICTNIRTHIYILLCAGMVAAADSSSRLPACLLSHPCPPLLHAFLHTSSKMPSKIQARSCLAFGTVDINSCSILWSMRKRAGGVSLASARFCVRSLWCEKFVPLSRPQITIAKIRDATITIHVLSLSSIHVGQDTLLTNSSFISRK